MIMHGVSLLWDLHLCTGKGRAVPGYSHTAQYEGKGQSYFDWTGPDRNHTALTLPKYMFLALIQLQVEDLPLLLPHKIYIYPQ